MKATLSSPCWEASYKSHQSLFSPWGHQNTWRTLAYFRMVRSVPKRLKPNLPFLAQNEHINPPFSVTICGIFMFFPDFSSFFPVSILRSQTGSRSAKQLLWRCRFLPLYGENWLKRGARLVRFSSSQSMTTSEFS